MGKGSDDMTGTGGIGKWIVIFALVVIIPALLITDFSLEKAQQKVNENAGTLWAAKLQRAVALGYSIKGNAKVSAERYEWAARLFYHQNDDDTGSWMTYEQAVETEYADSTGKWAALGIYEDLANRYSEREVGARAAKQVTRIKTMSRP